MKHTPAIIIGVVSAVMLLLVITSGIGYVEYRDWERFKRQNNCKLVDQMTTVVSEGVEKTAVIDSPKREAWLCNDGITYWR